MCCLYPEISTIISPSLSNLKEFPLRIYLVGKLVIDTISVPRQQDTFN